MADSLRLVETDGGYALDGELDLANASMVRDLSARLDGFVVTVDLSGLTFVDSSGLHALLHLKRAHPTVRLVNPAPQLRRLVELTQTTALLFEE